MSPEIQFDHHIPVNQTENTRCRTPASNYGNSSSQEPSKSRVFSHNLVNLPKIALASLKYVKCSPRIPRIGLVLFHNTKGQIFLETKTDGFFN
jgi:hypothetical protein